MVCYHFLCNKIWYKKVLPVYTFVGSFFYLILVSIFLVNLTPFSDCTYVIVVWFQDFSVTCCPLYLLSFADKLRDIVTQLVAVSKTYAIPEILKEIETSLIHEKDTLSSSKTRKTSKTQTIFTELINDVSSCTSSSSESSQPSNT